jgi:hypothetical protein
MVQLIDIWSFYDPLVYFIAICYSLWSFGIFSLIVVFCTKKNLATLVCFPHLESFVFRLCITRRYPPYSVHLTFDSTCVLLAVYTPLPTYKVAVLCLHLCACMNVRMCCNCYIQLTLNRWLQRPNTYVHRYIHSYVGQKSLDTHNLGSIFCHGFLPIFIF